MHKKTIPKTVLLVVLFVLFTTIIPLSVSADGGMFFRPPNLDIWMTLPQEKQIGIINYKDGYEKLILVVDIKNSSLQGDRVAWIFPVPSPPDTVTIDILDTVPRLAGSDIKTTAKRAINTPYYYLYGSQPYTIPFAILSYFMTNMIVSSGLGGLGEGKGYDYTVYESIEKMGLTTEKVGANSSASFQVYLESHNLSLPEEANTIIDEYIGSEYCFIVSWISDVEAFRTHALVHYNENYYYYDYYMQNEPVFLLGVSINFPTEQIYYPLKLTSIYGSQTIPMYIQILDYVTPTSYPDVSTDGFMKTQYYYSSSFNVPWNLTTFFAEQITQTGHMHDTGEGTYYSLSELRYTEIEIQTRAQYLTEDLWLDDSPPAEIATYSFITTNTLLVLLIIFIFCSCLASLLAGILIYRKQKPSMIKFTVLGLANFGGLLGFFIASHFLKVENTFVKIPSTNEKTKRELSGKKMGLGFGIFVLALAFVCFLMFGFNPYASFFSLIFVFLIVLLFSLPVVGTILLFMYGYQKNKQKTSFIAAFSLFCFIFILFIHIILIIL